MTATAGSRPLVRNVEGAERRWFYGGGVHTQLATCLDTTGSFYLASMQLQGGKATPLHTHPSDESLYVVEGELLVHLDGQEHTVASGGLTLAPRGVPHAFKVVSSVATVLMLHTPGSGEAFYLAASEPLDPGATSGPVDFERVIAAGRATGEFELVGPPPF